MQPSLFILEDNEWRTFYIKDDNSKLWVEVTIVTFLDAIATVDVLTPAIKNDGKHIEIRTVHFARPKVSFRFWENKQTRRRLLVLANFITCFPLEYHAPDVALMP